MSSLLIIVCHLFHYGWRIIVWDNSIQAHSLTVIISGIIQVGEILESKCPFSSFKLFYIFTVWVLLPGRVEFFSCHALSYWILAKEVNLRWVATPSTLHFTASEPRIFGRVNQWSVYANQSNTIFCLSSHNWNGMFYCYLNGISQALWHLCFWFPWWAYNFYFIQTWLGTKAAYRRACSNWNAPALPHCHVY